MSLFVLASKDGWVDIMYDGLDAVGVDQQVLTISEAPVTCITFYCNNINMPMGSPYLSGSLFIECKQTLSQNASQSFMFSDNCKL